MPTLSAREARYFEIFTEISRRHDRGEFLAPIPVSEIEAYCRLLGYNGLGRRANILRFVSACDDAWLNVQAEKARRKGQS